MLGKVAQSSPGLVSLPSFNREPMIPIHCSHPCACSICGHADVLLAGCKDFGVSGNDHFEGRRIFADFGISIAYHECARCGFLFTNAFDRWTPEQWRLHVYNEEYLLADPPFQSERPLRNAQWVASLFNRELPDLSILDVGGGNGKFAEALSHCGARIESHDPLYGQGSLPSERCFDLITSFEVIEHVPHEQQRDWMHRIAALLRKSPFARILISTEVLQPHLSVDWWYVCPRNGHISIHSTRSLAILAERVGMNIFSINPSMHLLCWREHVTARTSAREPTAPSKVHDTLCERIEGPTVKPA